VKFKQLNINREENCVALNSEEGEIWRAHRLCKYPRREKVRIRGEGNGEGRLKRGDDTKKDRKHRAGLNMRGLARESVNRIISGGTREKKRGGDSQRGGRSGPNKESSEEIEEKWKREKDWTLITTLGPICTPSSLKNAAEGGRNGRERDSTPKESTVERCRSTRLTKTRLCSAEHRNTFMIKLYTIIRVMGRSSAEVGAVGSRRLRYDFRGQGERRPKEELRSEKATTRT